MSPKSVKALARERTKLRKRKSRELAKTRCGNENKNEYFDSTGFR